MSEPRIFISHKNTTASNACADVLQRELRDNNFKRIFLDIVSLNPADNWRQTLLDNLANMDVLIVLIEAATADSDWVQREVDMARGTKTSILPVLVDTDYNAVEEALDRLDMHNTQYVEWNLKNLSPIINSIARLSDRTRDNQEQLCHKWSQRRNKQTPPKPNPRLYTFSHPDINDLRFHIACGDATRLTGYEVLINTENNYMQMARFHEKNTLSRHVRVKGAKRVNGRIEEDTLQEQLYDQVKRSSVRFLPLQTGQVVITGPGHEDSDLAKHFRFVLHAAAVELNWHQLDIKSLPAASNHVLVENCLKRLQEIDDNEGRVIYQEDGTLVPPATEAAADTYQPIKSVLFPVFGAGEGGNPLPEAVEGIVSGFDLHLEMYRGALTDIGLSIYSEHKTSLARQVFLNRGFREEN